MRPLRICILIDTLAMGGAERVAVVTACELSKRGHAVVLVAYHASNDFAETLNASKVCTVLIRASRAGRFRALRRFFSSRIFDVVHAYKATSAIWGLSASVGLKRGAWFAGHHMLFSESLAVRALCRLLRPRLRGWIVPSEAAAAVATRDYDTTGTTIHVVHNPIALPLFQRTRGPREAKRALNLTPDTQVVTMVANLHPWKNYPLFLRMAQRVCSSNFKVVFLSVGRDLQHGMIQAQSLAMGLKRDVLFLGHRVDVAAVLEATDVAVNTSPKESFCLALAEAGAMGLPCVSIENGGADEVLIHGRTGFLVPLNSEVELAERTVQLLGDDELRATMGRAARQTVATRFAPERVVDQLMRLYTQ